MTERDRDTFIAYLNSVKSGAMAALSQHAKFPQIAEAQRQKIQAVDVILEELQSVQTNEG